MAEEAETFGKRMRERRKELDLTQREVAERMAGKTEGKDISRYETGKHFPESPTRVEIAKALETSLEDLYAGPVAKRKPAKSSENGSGPLDQLSRSDSDLLREVSSQVTALASTVAALESQVQELLQRTPKRDEESGGK